MIVRSHPVGQSFKWLGFYLTHDVKAETDKRVPWTHTLNLAHDDVGSAVHEMYQTFLDREVLKKEAGVRPGASSVKKPVKHVSLSWDPSEKPTRQDMIAAAESYLAAMGWNEHQCLVVPHTDKSHAHVHLMINMVHPERGTRLRDGYEWLRAEPWALHYEQSRGKVFCEQRLKITAEREPSPPRNVWEQLRVLQEYRSELPSPDRGGGVIDYNAPPREWRRQEWDALKALQKADRLAFFEEGRKVYGALRQSVYADVRQAYRREWAAYFMLMKTGAPQTLLTTLKADLAARQSTLLREKCRAAAQTLRSDRDTTYLCLKEQQKEARAVLAARQESGLTSAHLFGTAPIVREPEVSEAVPMAATSVMPSPTPMPSQSAFYWTPRARLAAQQRSAQRWLDRAIDRLAHPTVDQRAATHRSLAAAAHRLAKDERRDIKAEKTMRPVGIEPDL